MRVLIVGCGRLGSDIAELLVRGGHAVFGLRRSNRALPEGVVGLVGDVSLEESLFLPDSMDACVYAVAAGERSDAAYRAAYPAGAGNVIRALERSGSGAARFLFVSSTGVYGQTDGSLVNEASPTEPAGFTGQRMLEAERLVQASALPSCALRLSGIYGPSRRVLLERVGRGEATYPAEGDRWMNQIHQLDAARAVVHVLGMLKLPQALCVSDSRPAQRREVLMWLADRMGAPAPKASGAPADPAKRVDSGRLRATGFEFRFPTYVEGYESFVG